VGSCPLFALTPEQAAMLAGALQQQVLAMKGFAPSLPTHFRGH
jgi:hypothetical protein